MSKMMKKLMKPGIAANYLSQTQKLWWKSPKIKHYLQIQIVMKQN